MMKKYLVKIGLYLARLGGWAETVCTRVHAEVSAELLKSAKMFIEQVEKGFAGASGEFKRSQVLRALMNRHSEASEKDCAWAIELAIRQ